MIEILIFKYRYISSVLVIALPNLLKYILIKLKFALPFPPFALAHQRPTTASTMSRARVYCDVNEKRPRESWDYENLTVTWGYVFGLLMHTTRLIEVVLVRDCVHLLARPLPPAVLHLLASSACNVVCACFLSLLRALC